MKIIDRYLIKEIFPPTMVGILVFTFVILTSQFLRLMEMIINKGVGILAAMRLIIFLLPSILVLTIPMSVLLGTLVTFGRLSADNEITALKSGGLSLFRLTVPVFFFSLGAYLLTGYLINNALPHGNRSFRSLMFEIVRSKATIGLKERVFNDDFDGLIIYINDIPVSTDPVMKGIVIHDYRGELEKPMRQAVTIFAEAGHLISDTSSHDVVFRLKNGSIHSLGKDRTKYQQLGFDTHDLRLTMDQELINNVSLPKGLREMSIDELKNKIAQQTEKGLPTHAPLVELHKKYAIPFACLIFGILGVSLGVVFHRGEKMVSFALCVAVVIIYYVFLVGGEPVGKKGIIPAWLAMWGGNIFFMGLTLILFWSAVYEKLPSLRLTLPLKVLFRRGDNTESMK